MKLLDKREIDRARAAERKLEIQQGAQLASRVDKLRELASKEESSLGKFVEETRKAALEQAAEYVRQRDQAWGEAETAKNQRDALLRPINDRAEEFAQREAALEDAKVDLKRREDALLERSRAQDLRDQASKVREQESLELEAELKQAISEAAGLNKEARRASSEAAKTLADARQERDSRLEEAERREKDLRAREAAHAADRGRLANELRELSLRERAIIDREEALARELTRQVNKQT